MNIHTIKYIILILLISSHTSLQGATIFFTDGSIKNYKQIKENKTSVTSIDYNGKKETYNRKEIIRVFYEDYTPEIFTVRLSWWRDTALNPGFLPARARIRFW